MLSYLTQKTEVRLYHLDDTIDNATKHHETETNFQQQVGGQEPCGGHQGA